MGQYEFDGKKPRVDPEAYVSPRASLIGDIEIMEHASIWEFASLRADMNFIRIGRGSSIQDNVTVHTTFMNPTVVGEYVTAGHNCVIHACTIGDRTVIGMGAIVLDGAEVGDDCVIGAGSVVTEGKVIPDGSLVLGIPGKVVKEVSDQMKEVFKAGAELYVELAKQHKTSDAGKSK
ncbi:MAG: gamma carbonic anhydrase family protein [Candidatus Thorarchaeota archaeon]|jgi:carbonic anhydrase/acetyltransferase-like protein (isoleucine patch superfamily)